jgi:hypothetical protein
MSTTTSLRGTICFSVWRRTTVLWENSFGIRQNPDRYERYGGPEAREIGHCRRTAKGQELTSVEQTFLPAIQSKDRKREADIHTTNLGRQ